MNVTMIFQMILGVINMLALQLKKPDSITGVKETKEVFSLVNEMALFLCLKLKDGAQISDATDFYNLVTSDESFKKYVKDAFDGYKQIPAEFKDIDAGEALDLTALQVSYVPKIIEALKKS